jgi:GNAT superfamily N-acetyltransferase
MTPVGPVARLESLVLPRLQAGGVPHGAFVLEMGPIDPDDLYDVPEIESAVWLEQLSAEPQQTGIGRRVMGAVTAAADELGLTLYLNPWAQGSGGLPQIHLEGWYERLGFRWWKGEAYHIMVRYPQR